MRNKGPIQSRPLLKGRDKIQNYNSKFKISERVYIGIGSNLGDRRRNIEAAIKKLRKTEGIRVRKVSSLIETEPEGGQPQNRFLNGAIEIKTKLLPHELLKQLKRIEKELGRVKTIKNGPRPIDLDILLYGDEKINSPHLKIPHPRMYKREFVMRPLKELDVGAPTPLVSGRIELK